MVRIRLNGKTVAFMDDSTAHDLLEAMKEVLSPDAPVDESEHGPIRVIRVDG